MFTKFISSVLLFVKMDESDVNNMQDGVEMEIEVHEVSRSRSRSQSSNHKRKSRSKGERESREYSNEKEDRRSRKYYYREYDSPREYSREKEDRTRTRYRSRRSYYTSRSRSRSYSRSYSSDREYSRSRSRRRSKSPRKRRHKSSKSSRRHRSKSKHSSKNKRSKRHRHDVSDSDCDGQSSASLIKELQARINSLEQRQGSPVFSSYEQNDDTENIDIQLSPSQPEDDFLAIINEGTETTKKGPSLKKDGLLLANNFFDKEPDNSQLKTLKDKYLEPENCTNLSAKQVNSEIFRFLNPNIKKKDFCLKVIQGAVSTAATANLQLIDEFAALKRDSNVGSERITTMFQKACDATKLLSKAYADLSVFRKFIMRPHIQSSYQQLCAKRTYGQFLFGDDLAKEVKSIDDESKIMRQFNRPNSNFYRYSHPDSRASKNGLHRGRGQFRPQFGQYRHQFSQYRGRNRPYRARGGRQPLSQTSTPAAQQ